MAHQTPAHPAAAPVQAHPALPPQKPSAFPTAPAHYAHALRTPRAAWWRGVVAIVLLVIGYLVANVVATIPAIVIDFASGRYSTDDLTSGAITMSPAMLAATGLSLAALTPLAMLLQWWLFGQRPRHLSSVEGRFRWRWMLRAAAIVVPVYAVYITVFTLAGGGESRPTAVADLIAYTIIVVVTIPLQAAGEEYGFRGLINRAVGSWTSRPTVALVLGGVISSVVFMLAHGSTDPWLNAYYFVFGAALCVIAWRTGGLEVPVLLHAVNNVFAFLPAVFRGQMHSAFERGAGVGGPFMLIPIAVAVLTAGLVEWQTRRAGVRRLTPATPLADPPAIGADQPAAPASR